MSHQGSFFSLCKVKKRFPIIIKYCENFWRSIHHHIRVQLLPYSIIRPRPENRGISVGFSLNDALWDLRYKWLLFFLLSITLIYVADVTMSLDRKSKPHGGVENIWIKIPFQLGKNESFRNDKNQHAFWWKSIG